MFVNAKKKLGLKAIKEERKSIFSGLLLADDLGCGFLRILSVS